MVNDGRLKAGTERGTVTAASVAAYLRGGQVTESTDGDFPPLRSLEQLAQENKISEVLLKKAARAGQFAHIKLGRGIYLTPEQWRALLAAHTDGDGSPTRVDNLAATRARVLNQRPRRSGQKTAAAR